MRDTRRRNVNAALAVAGIAAVAIAATLGLRAATGAPFPAYRTPSNQPDTSHTRGTVGSTLLASSGVEITLVGVEKGSTRWLFRVKVSNASGAPAAVLGRNMVITGSMHADQSQLDHQFVIAVMAPGATYGGFLEWRPAGSPSSSEAAAHPALAATVAAHGTSEGWVAMDITNIGMSAPSQLVYTFDPVASRACIKPTDPSTCSPETLYHVLAWDLG